MSIREDGRSKLPLLVLTGREKAFMHQFWVLSVGIFCRDVLWLNVKIFFSQIVAAWFDPDICFCSSDTFYHHCCI
ncbi:hypothetical protein F0562_011679 [Nyssa sinensis]|uniref:Uncharacterized protein n=1 Tax=Nyssa sinensis TaxID=561372 RepID=A0A5J4ZQ60_9ASTE|nr:hypothetical protein F0562_011679 [Nyssa sinensis]